MNLKASNYKLFNDSNSSNLAKEELFATSISEAIEQCQLVFIMLPKNYLTSKQSILLSRFVKRKNTNDSTLKVFPLFYKLTLSDLMQER